MKNQNTFSAIFCTCLFALLSFCSYGQQRKFVESMGTKPFIYVPRASTPNGPTPSRSPFRTLDGTFNNLGASRILWGASDVPMVRELSAEYGSTDPKNAMGGSNRPSAREVSNVLCDEPETIFSGIDLSAMAYVWGQYIDHDITLTPSGSTEYVPVVLPANEALFTVNIPFFRSEVHAGTGLTNTREQTNLNTAWIDGSVVYGIDSSRASWLRTNSRGKLKTSTGNMLPWNTTTGEKSAPIDPNAPSMDDDADHTVKTIVTGDIRGAEHPGLTSIHTMFVREHNRICDRLYAEGFRNDEDIYQKARKEVSGIIQAITYQEFLPALGIKLSRYTGYKSTVKPDIANTFATASYRIGHTMVADGLALRSNSCAVVQPDLLELVDVFNDPQIIFDYTPEVFLKGFTTHKAYETNLKINSQLRDFLFGNIADPVRFGLDLAALNIQRGRDHGLPNYNRTRAFYGQSTLTNFSQISRDPAITTALQNLYGSINNIDLWVGLLAEDVQPNKAVGKTMEAMLKSQFEKLRDGDFYFYLNDPFMPSSVRNNIINSKLSDVIQRNSYGTLSSLPENVFFIKTCPGEDGEDRMAMTAIENSESSNFSVYPNPVTDILNITTNYQEVSSIQLFAIEGGLVKTIQTNKGESTTKIDTSNLPNGMYFISLSNNQGNKTVKFVKQ